MSWCCLGLPCASIVTLPSLVVTGPVCIINHWLIPLYFKGELLLVSESEWWHGSKFLDTFSCDSVVTLIGNNVERSDFALDTSLREKSILLKKKKNHGYLLVYD